MSQRRTLIVLGALVALLIGCRDAREREGGTGRVGEPSDTAMSSSTSDSLQFTIEVPDRVRLGDAVPITLRVTNTDAESLTLYLQGRPVAFDIIVSRDDGRVVWRRLEGKVVSMILQVRTLAPGEQLVLSDKWDQRTSSGEPVEPGRYIVHGELLTDDAKPRRTPPVSLLLVEK